MALHCGQILHWDDICRCFCISILRATLIRPHSTDVYLCMYTFKPIRRFARLGISLQPYCYIRAVPHWRNGCANDINELTRGKMGMLLPLHISMVTCLEVGILSMISRCIALPTYHGRSHDGDGVWLDSTSDINIPAPPQASPLSHPTHESRLRCPGAAHDSHHDSHASNHNSHLDIRLDNHPRCPEATYNRCPRYLHSSWFIKVQRV